MERARLGLPRVPALLGTVIAAAAAIASLSLIPIVNRLSATMALLGMVLAAACSRGAWTAIAVALAGAGAVDFFYFHPPYRFGIGSFEDLVTLAALLTTATVTSTLVARVRAEAASHARQSALAHARARDLQALYRVSQLAAAARTPDGLVEQVGPELSRLLGLSVTCVVPEADLTSLSAPDRHAVARCLGDGLPAGSGIDPQAQPARAPGVGVSCLPVRSSHRTVAALVVTVPPGADPPNPESIHLWQTMADQIGVAFERARLDSELAEARVFADTQRFRDALLSSVAHDLRSPLSAIIGAASSLLDHDTALDAERRQEMVRTIHQSGQRLSRYIRNLLDISTVEFGMVSPQREWQDLADIIGTAVREMGPVLGRRRLKIDVAPGLPLLLVDFVLIERVFINVLENAVRFSPVDGMIAIAVRSESGVILAEVFNQGPLVPANQLERLFDRFRRLDEPRQGGLGLGLSICRGFMAVHGGTITAHRDVARGGMVFHLSFPIPLNPETPEVSDD